MHLRRGLVFSLFFSAGALTWSGCAGHGSAIVPKTADSASHSVHHAISSFKKIVHPTSVQIHPDASMSGSTAPSESYAGTVKTLGALIENPTGLAYDSDDSDIYIVDHTTNGSQVLRVYPNGATAVLASLSGSASQIVYDHATRMFYVTSGGGSVDGDQYPGVYQITDKGVVSVLAGGQVYGVVDGTGSSAGFEEPTGITLDPANGLMYFADYGVVRSISTAGTVKTITGSNIFSGYAGSYGIGVTYNPKDGNIYVANGPGETILQVTTAGAVTAFAGSCVSNISPSCVPLERDGTGTSALFDSPLSITADPVTGDMYVADQGNNAVRKITLKAGVSVLAGSGLQTETDGIGLAATFDSPVQIAMGTTKAYVLDANSNSPVVHSLRSVTVHGATAPLPTSKIRLFQTPSLDPQLGGIAANLNSTYIWFTEGIAGGGKIGRMTSTGSATEYSVAGTPQAIALGADGTPWFTTSGETITIGHLVDGSATEWTIPNAWNPFSYYDYDDLALGPDGNMWFAFNSSGYSNGIIFGNVTASGSVTEYNLPNFGCCSSTQPSLAFTKDGNAWVSTGGGIMEVSTQGAVLNEFSYAIDSVTQGPDGNLWFDSNGGSYNSSAVGTLRTNPNVLELYPIISQAPGCQSNNYCSRTLNGIASGPDGNLWMADQISGGFSSIASMSTTGIFNEYVIPAAHPQPLDAAPGPDGNMWFIDAGAEKIGRMKLH